MAWSYITTQRTGTTHYTVSVTDADGITDSQYGIDVAFHELDSHGSRSLSTTRYAEDEDTAGLLLTDIGSILSASQIEAGYSFTLDLSGVEASSLNLNMLRYSTHYRADAKDRSVDDVTDTTLGSIFTEIIGTDGNDNLKGSAIAEILRGGDGDDYLQGLGGDDALYGDAGNDTLSAGSGSDTLDGGEGNDTAWFRWVVAYEDVSVGSTLLSIEDDSYNSDTQSYYADYSDEAGTFKALYDAYDGFDGNNVALWVDLESGFSFGYFQMDADILAERGRSDEYQDRLYQNELTNIENVTATSHFSKNDDGVIITGSVILEGDGNANHLIGAHKHDWLFGEAGNDVIFGAGGQDNIYGGIGDDNIDGGHGADQIYGEAGNDRLSGNQGSDHIFGGNGEDIIRGNRSDDELFGGAGDDRIIGGKGNDTISGGSGDDTLKGGDGADRFILDLTSTGDNGTDEIIDFMRWDFEGDVLVFDTDGGNETSLEAIGVDILFTAADDENSSVTSIVNAEDNTIIYAHIYDNNLSGADIGDSFLEVV